MVVLLYVSPPRLIFVSARIVIIFPNQTIMYRICFSQLKWIKPQAFACSYLTEAQKTNGLVRTFANDSGSAAFQDACQMFEELSDLNVVSATSMIGSFSKQHLHGEAIYLFSRMLVSIIRPNEFTFGTVLHSSTALGNLNMGKQLHACATKIGLNSNVFVGSALLDLYVKLSTSQEAQCAFEDTKQPNVVSYTTLICGYLKQERFEDALRLFQDMPERNIVSWNAMVAANIATSGMGRSFHACAVKFLGIGFWKALLGGCQIHSNMELGEHAAQKILALDPDDVSSYVMLSNAHSAAGRWLFASTIRREMHQKGMKRVPGCSWIEIRSNVHVFVTADKNHHEKDEIYKLLRFCIENLRDDKAFNLLLES
ncbi:putative Pentatricopeptide repeat-containing protein [Quillaja saponaria]|uniref:Pentatricopeptide repeat-containing protein n=1 Tax=Quillaja saponaria TaxID=32244 RepID=A0AAD7Q3E1_QUISA|nr:putative Pentatricopeptide repeat-containing protein [Quillaja saponaria]